MVGSVAHGSIPGVVDGSIASCRVDFARRSRRARGSRARDRRRQRARRRGRSRVRLVVPADRVAAAEHGERAEAVEPGGERAQSRASARCCVATAAARQPRVGAASRPRIAARRRRGRAARAAAAAPGAAGRAAASRRGDRAPQAVRQLRGVPAAHRDARGPAGETAAAGRARARGCAGVQAAPRTAPARRSRQPIDAAAELVLAPRRPARPRPTASARAGRRRSRRW